MSIGDFRMQGNKSKMPDVAQAVDIRHALFLLSVLL
jgi:hypothetical protein